MSTQHTPGPWEIVSDHKSPRIESDHGEFVCVASVDAAGFVGLRFPNGGAYGPDAHLIAAAPDMYAALKAVTDVLIEFREGGEYSGSTSIEDWPELQAAHAALAKAEGKS